MRAPVALRVAACMGVVCKGRGAGESGRASTGAQWNWTSDHPADEIPASWPLFTCRTAAQVGLKCADVGHLAAPWEVHHRWVSGLEEEFFRQGDKEKSMHMMVSPLMDRCKDGITKSQVGAWVEWGLGLPGLKGGAMVTHKGVVMRACRILNLPERVWRVTRLA